MNLGHSEKISRCKAETNNKQNLLTPPCRRLSLSITSTPFPFNIVIGKRKATRKYSCSTFVHRIERNYINLLWLHFFSSGFDDVFWSNDFVTTFCFICLRAVIETVCDSHLKPSGNYVRVWVEHGESVDVSLLAPL